jgi:DNA-binding helix-turn-helix protein
MSYQIEKFLTEFLNKKNMTLTDFSKKMEVTHVYVSNIKNGKKTASKKFVEKMIKKFPECTRKETELLTMLEKDKKIEKLKKLEKQRRETIGKNEELDKISRLNKRERVQLDEVMNSAAYFFNDASVSDEDKKRLHDTLQELFFDAKMKNKRK